MSPPITPWDSAGSKTATCADEAKGPVWDLPIRILHWGFAILLATSVGLALGAEHNPTLFRWHMLLGLAASGLLVLRVALGFAGSRYARFWNFPLRPSAVATYFKGIFSNATTRYPGHNPGSALAATSMFVLIAALVSTGAGWGGGELKEAHGPLAYTLIAVIVLHLAGLGMHAVRHRENVLIPMLTGRKQGNPDQAAKALHPVWSCALVLAGVMWIVSLFQGHTPGASTARLPLTGTVVSLGKDGRREGRHSDREHEDHGRGSPRSHN